MPYCYTAIYPSGFGEILGSGVDSSSNRCKLCLCLRVCRRVAAVVSSSDRCRLQGPLIAWSLVGQEMAGGGEGCGVSRRSITC